MKHSSALLLAGIVTVGTAFAAEVDLSKLPPPSTKPGLAYEKDIRPIFEASCFGCHSPQRQRPAGGLRLDTLELALKGGKDGKVIVPGDSAKSLLVIAVSRLDPEMMMPPPPRQRRGGPPGNPPGGGNPQNPPTAQPQGMGMDEPLQHLAEGQAPPPGDAPPGGAQRGPQGPPPKPLTPEQVGLIRAWIDQGAK